MMPPLVVPSGVLDESLEILRVAGQARCECVVLWLARRDQSSLAVETCYRPEQIAAEDFFKIPREAMVALFDVLRSRDLMVAAQVHTHPARAFHSLADDRWAIVRHVGALSIVVPFFARDTTAGTFFRDSAVFQLSSENTWDQVGAVDVQRYVRGAT